MFSWVGGVDISNGETMKKTNMKTSATTWPRKGCETAEQGKGKKT